jgi:hypothetical protein
VFAKPPQVATPVYYQEAMPPLVRLAQALLGGSWLWAQLCPRLVFFSFWMMASNRELMSEFSLNC